MPSLAYLSLTAVHRRGWGSLYDALAVGTMDAPALRELVGRWPLDDGQPIYALDTSVWPRDDAETSPERGYHYSASRQSAGQPIVAGWSYGWLAQVSFTHDSWTAPLDVRRVAPTDDAHAVAAAQIRDLLGRLPADGPVPLCVFDAGYDPETLARELGDLDGERVAVLVRLRSGRCFYADPEPAAAHRPARAATGGSSPATTRPPGGRRPRSTARSTPSTGGCGCAPGPTCTPRRRTIPTRGSRRTRPIVRGTLVLVEVERLPRQTRIPKQLWLWWRGPGAPDLAVLWRAYVHRFDLEHTYRFCKQTLNWTTPARPPPRAGRSLDLAGAAGLHPAPPGPPRHRGSAPPLGGPQRPDAGAHPRPRAPGVSAALGLPRHARRRAKTLRPLAGPADRGALRPGAALPGHQEERLSPRQPPRPSRHRPPHDGRSKLHGLKRKLRSPGGPTEDGPPVATLSLSVRRA